MAGQDRVLDRRDDRLLVADDAGEDLRARRASRVRRLARSSSLTVRGRQPDGAEVAQGAMPRAWLGRSGSTVRSPWLTRARTASLSVVPRSVKRLGRAVATDRGADRVAGRSSPAATRCSRTVRRRSTSISKSPARRPTRRASSGVIPQPKCSKASSAGSQVARTAGPRRWTWPCSSRATGRT